jgi:hypothetical protein
MNPFRQNAIFALVLILLAATLTAAQATRTWVSGVGDDANPCSRTAPCKTFAGAISKTAVNGEINCLDPAGYGAVTITKSITIDCEDTQGSILAAGTNGVIINITSSTDSKKAVKLRGLSINGAATGINGIRILAANSVNIDELVIDGFTQHGVSIETTAGNVNVNVRDSGIRSNVGNGINTFITNGTVLLAISNCRVSTSATGVNLSNNTRATISNSVMNGNTTGIVAFNAAIGVINCDVSLNGTGLSALTGGAIRISANLITGNSTGLATSGGSIVSLRNNTILGNTVDGAVTSTAVLQ